MNLKKLVKDIAIEPIPNLPEDDKELIKYIKLNYVLVNKAKMNKIIANEERMVKHMKNINKKIFRSEEEKRKILSERGKKGAAKRWENKNEKTK